MAEENRRFMVRVYNWMATGLALTGIVATGIASSEALLYAIISNKVLFYGLLIAEFLMVLGFVSLAKSVSARVAMVLFCVYAIMNGVTFSPIHFSRNRFTQFLSSFLLTLEPTN